MLPSTEQRLQCCKQKVPFCSDYYGRYWARTSDPQLSTRGGGSDLFTDVRPERTVERNQSASEHLTERERTSSVAIVATPRRRIESLYARPPGLSRRRSRVRVPSLPSLEVPANRHLSCPMRRSPDAAWPNPVAQTPSPKCLQNSAFPTSVVAGRRMKPVHDVGRAMRRAPRVPLAGETAKLKATTVLWRVCRPPRATVEFGDHRLTRRARGDRDQPAGRARAAVPEVEAERARGLLQRRFVPTLRKPLEELRGRVRH
jgi:hypothetical protein